MLICWDCFPVPIIVEVKPPQDAEKFMYINNSRKQSHNLASKISLIKLPEASAVVSSKAVLSSC